MKCCRKIVSSIIATKKTFLYGDHYVRVGWKMESSRSHANNPSNAKWKGANVESYSFLKLIYYDIIIMKYIT